jgi:peptide/nickel transport system permease protein
MKRIIFSILILYAVITVNFVIFMMMPGDPTLIMASSIKLKNPEIIQSVTEKFGLDRPMHERYVKYVFNMLTFEFGYSYYTNKPVIEQVGMRLQNTLLLVIPPELLSIVVGVMIGVIVAEKRGGLLDSASVITALAVYALPVFWIAMMLVMVFSFQLQWLPSGYTFPDWWASQPHAIWEEMAMGLKHLILPWATLFLLSCGGYILLVRATMLECITEDYVLTARAKGLKKRTVLFKHTLKNALLPLITDIAIVFGFTLSGAIITEQLFRYPGMGWWIWDSISTFDYPVLQTVFYVIAICVIVANLIADILYGVVDPRIRYG